MLTAKFNNKGRVVQEGVMEAGDIYQGVCCEGSGFEVIEVRNFGRMANQNSLIGMCHNPECPAGPRQGIYMESFALRLAQGLPRFARK